MTPDELHERIMNIIKMQKDGLLTEHDVSDMIAFNILTFCTELLEVGK